ncbi:PA0069 family radical SAM protein [Exilibacterium tricleocarpae]|uniref:PA0069 family radical SAM protein n=1 Tax=Exilibacterium tricleocarpae TaxID=2591008 RepID=A0A545U5P3_9GAMM|nr:PA0069 family radical SAM protein [Exilibacterium tricleocarpae]TQV84788.1 PA0069 family radical SAM protein [Exilibacterium tricleocarpae]
MTTPNGSDDAGAGRPLKGRGALSNPAKRFDRYHTLREDDGWCSPAAETSVATDVRPEYAKSIIARNGSPDVPFDQSINPYRGCEHGCVYCFARPTHAYWDLSPGLDFETKLFYKANAVELLEQQLRHPGYRCKPLVFGTNTDPYQPIEKFYQVTRKLLELLYARRHPVSIVTKGGLIERDIDLLGAMAKRRLCSVMISVTTLDSELKRRLEPRAAAPQARLKLVEQLRGEGVPTGVLMAPIIPMINDAEIETLLRRCSAAGALSANYILLRLPLEVKSLFYEWLRAHYPQRAEHVISLIRQSRGGADYQSAYGTRMRGTGVYAELIAKRFALARKKLGLVPRREWELDCSQFTAPPARELQLQLF